MRFLRKHWHRVVYGLSMALLLFLLKWLEIRFVIMDHALEVYIGAIAAIFTGLGIWLALKLSTPRKETLVIEKTVYVTAPSEFVPNDKGIKKLNLSPRELEVLQLMAEGLSNQEIAGRLYVSLNTVKTHSSNLFEKMDVSRRTQAVDKAKKLGIIA